MENLTQALYMAAAMMFLVLALGLTLDIFGKALDAGKKIVANGHTTSYIESINYEELFDSLSADSSLGNINLIAKRHVTANTIIPELYRYRKESYILKLYNNTMDDQKPDLYHMFFHTLETSQFMRTTKQALDFNEPYLQDVYNEFRLDLNPNNEQEVANNTESKYMFKSPWGHPDGSQEKERIEYFIHGQRGFIGEQTQMVDYRKFNLRDYAGNANGIATADDKTETSIFEEIVIEYNYLGEVRDDVEYSGSGQVIINEELFDTEAPNKHTLIMYRKIR